MTERGFHFGALSLLWAAALRDVFFALGLLLLVAIPLVLMIPDSVNWRSRRLEGVRADSPEAQRGPAEDLGATFRRDKGEPG